MGSAQIGPGLQQGGDLIFPEFFTRRYHAPAGGAVVFCCSMLHEATPVTRGKRYAYLPLFYEDAGAPLREENIKAGKLPPELSNYRA
jgi:hypothetical protein